jgi:type I site-specific restriction-modification system R (restriction) subunit
MQTLARVNRTFRGKPDGLLVAYAPLAENLNKALAEYTATDQAKKPVGKNIDEAAAHHLTDHRTRRSLRRVAVEGEARRRTEELDQGRHHDDQPPALTPHPRQPGA